MLGILKSKFKPGDLIVEKFFDEVEVYGIILAVESFRDYNFPDVEYLYDIRYIKGDRSFTDHGLNGSVIDKLCRLAK